MQQKTRQKRTKDNKNRTPPIASPKESSIAPSKEKRKNSLSLSLIAAEIRILKFRNSSPPSRIPSEIVLQDRMQWDGRGFSPLRRIRQFLQSTLYFPPVTIEPSSMSSGTVRRVSRQDIQLVQNLIERCLQLYMNQKEVVDTLLEQAKIDPGFTELVWQKLEEENRDFFNAYYLRLMVKHQIMQFNKLLEQQVQLMQQMQSSGASALPTSNGTHMPTLPQNPACYATGPALRAENIQRPLASGLTNAFTNGGPPLPTSLHAAMQMSAHASRIDAPPNMLSSQTSNMGGLVQGINGGMIKTEAGYSGASPYMFGSDHSVLETRPPIGDTSVASFSSVDSTSQPINEALLDADSSSFGFLGQIPRNFSLSDLTADFSQSSDILESYPRSPFLATDNENFLDSRERGEQGDNRRLDPISESLNYGDFGSE